MLAVKVEPAGLHLDRCAAACSGQAAAEQSAAFYLLLFRSMLYRVQFEFGRNIDASSKDDALRKMCALMREHPESFVRGVQDAALAQGARPLWKRLLTGR